MDPELRSPSPEPVYDKKGFRLNTWENRMKSNLIVEKDNLIEECKEIDPNFIVPVDY